LEDWRKAYVVSIQSMSSVEGFTESWIACELNLCVIQKYFHLYDNIEIGVGQYRVRMQNGAGEGDLAFRRSLSGL